MCHHPQSGSLQRDWRTESTDAPASPLRCPTLPAITPYKGSCQLSLPRHEEVSLLRPDHPEVSRNWRGRRPPLHCPIRKLPNPKLVCNMPLSHTHLSMPQIQCSRVWASVSQLLLTLRRTRSNLKLLHPQTQCSKFPPKSVLDGTMPALLALLNSRPRK